MTASCSVHVGGASDAPPPGIGLKQQIIIRQIWAQFTSSTLTLLGWGGAESARTIFNRPFLHEKRCLEVPNFMTFPNSLRIFRKAKNNFR